MKAYRSYVRQKNSKQGIALSTAMAICIVLAILMAILVSMATLNITTTQTTISQRESYIQAKSAIAFAESYYSKNPDQIPGNSSGDTGGEAVFIFKDEVVAHGADIYITKTKDAMGSESELIASADVDTLRNGATKVYLDVVNTGAIVNFTAYCKYGDGDSYSLSKEYEYKNSAQARPSTFTGNILYSATADTRYLRIHVRTSNAFNNEPYIYTWGNYVNDAVPEPDDLTKAYPYGASASVNKLSYDENYGSEKFSGPWGDDGPTGTMEYEGNGWFVSEIQFTSSKKLNYINAIITRKGALRKNSGLDGATAQSWEIFDIPVPNDNGTGNGTDVYITLNQPTLRDARLVQEVASGYYWKDLNYNSGANNDGSADEMTWLFTDRFDSNIDKFAQFCGQWYTIYTKQVSAIVHYKKAGVTDDSAKPSGFDYEGYGWSRDVSRDFSATLKTADDTIYYYGSGTGTTLSYDSNGSDMITELFIVEGTDSAGNAISAEFGTEAEANKWLVTHCNDSSAPDYITINVKANEMPVQSAVTTTIDYRATIVEDTNPTPTPGSSTGGGSTPEPTPTPDSNGLEELEYQKLAKTETQTSGDATTVAIADWGVVGSFPGNDWGLDGGTKRNFSNVDKMESSGYIHSYTYTNLAEGTYIYKIISMNADSGEFEDTDVIWIGDPLSNLEHHNASVSVPSGADVTIRFDRESGTILDPIIDTHGGGYEPSGATFRIFSDKNNWGREEGDTVHQYSLADEMVSVGDGTYYYDITNISSGDLSSGNKLNLKVLKQLDTASPDDNTSAGWSADNSWGKQGTNPVQDYSIEIPVSSSMTKYSVRVYFNEYERKIWNDDPVEIQNISSDKFYAIGNFNDWGKNSTTGVQHDFDAATAGDQYFMGSEPTIDGNYAVYEVDIGLQEIGSYEVKVFSSSARADDGSINYQYSWGAADSNGITSGSDKAAVGIATDHLYYLKVIFKYDLTNPDKSRVQWSYTPVSHDDTVTSVQIGFHNAQLVNVNNTNEKTLFATPWTKAYVTYTTPRGMQKDVEVDFTKATGNVLWISVPSDAYDLYFSNKPFAERTTDGYESTVKLPNSRITNNYPIFVPTESENDSNGKPVWKFGDASLYRTYTNSVKDYTASGVEMVSVGSYQNNYYNVPLVNMLEEILKKEKGISGNFVFSAYPYPKYKVKENDVLKETVYFDRTKKQFIKYQGEAYFYESSNGWLGCSYLIVQDSPHADNPDYHQGGYLLRNQFSLETDTYHVATKMDNRQGAIFTSNGTYYDGSASAHDYGDYTPNWYTIKLPVGDEFTIENITGVTSSGTKIIDGNTTKTQVAKASEYYNRPLYIFYDKDLDGNTKTKFYTYDTEFGSVDTNSEGKVTVYFSKPDTWSNDVCLNAYSIVGAGYNDVISKDTTDGDHSYYKYEFPAGEYCFFRFYDKADPAKTTEILTLTGEESADREYKILCDAANDNLSEFVYYLHPRTKALYAWQEARAAMYAAEIPEKYTYDTSGYHEENSRTLAYLRVLTTVAENYYKGSGPWTSDASTDYNDKASAARTFAAAIKKARIYIAADPTTDDDDEKKYIFAERNARDDVLKYEDRWVGSLRYVHDQAMSLFDKDQTNTSTDLSDYADLTGMLIAYADEIDKVIAKPETTLNPDAIQIVVDNQVVAVEKKDASGNVIKDSSGNPVTEDKGGWDIGRIRLYTLDDTNNVAQANLKLFETTQSSEGFYAYVFMQNKFPTTKFWVSTISDVPNVTDLEALEKGKTYIYHTATNEFEEDTSIHTVTCAYDLVEKDGQAKYYGEYKSKSYGDEFSVMFQYDTTVKYDGKSYMIYAGCYTISKSYPGFRTDFSGETGINLFTDTARTYFSNPSRCGLTGSSTYPAYGEITADKSDSADVDVMTNSVNATAPLTFTSNETTGRVNFRWSNTKSNDTLTMPCDITLHAGVGSVAVNNLVLNGKEFKIEAKTVTFYCDTVIKTSTGKYTISHGTYIFNDKNTSSTLAEIKLSTTGTVNDWRKNYILVEEVQSDLGGGKFVVK